MGVRWNTTYATDQDKWVNDSLYFYLCIFFVLLLLCENFATKEKLTGLAVQIVLWWIPPCCVKKQSHSRTHILTAEINIKACSFWLACIIVVVWAACHTIYGNIHLIYGTEGSTFKFHPVNMSLWCVFYIYTSYLYMNEFKALFCVSVSDSTYNM